VALHTRRLAPHCYSHFRPKEKPMACAMGFCGKQIVEVVTPSARQLLNASVAQSLPRLVAVE